MSKHLNRRKALARFGGAMAALLTAPATHSLKAAVQKGLASSGADKDYDPTRHKWLMVFDATRCIGCGHCVEACKKENDVPVPYFRTWIERYVTKKAVPGSEELTGETLVDSPEGGMHGFPPLPFPKEEVLRAFYVPKLCNLCHHSPCTQACPVGATFDSPDGVPLVDKTYCIGCGFCIQACPYGCRFMNPRTHTADKCTLCYHRITHRLKPACVEVCPTQARIFGDVKNPVENDPIAEFLRKNRVHSLKPHLGTEPRVLYAGIDKEVR